MEYYTVIESRYEDGFTAGIKNLIDASSDREAFQKALNLTRRKALESGTSTLITSLTNNSVDVKFNSRTVNELNMVDYLFLRAG